MNFLNMETLGNFAGQLTSNNNNNSNNNNTNNVSQSNNDNDSEKPPLVKSLYEGLGTVIDSQISSSQTSNRNQQNSNQQQGSGSAIEGLGSLLSNLTTSDNNKPNQNNSNHEANNQNNHSTDQNNNALYEGLGAILSSQVDNAVKQNQSKEKADGSSNNNNPNQSSLGGSAITGLASMLSGGGGGGANSQEGNTQGGSKSAAFGAIESVFKALPKEQQKGIIMEAISPVILKVSPKWGSAIVGMLKNFDVTKLIPLAKDEKKLVKTVVEEEEKLEEAERKKIQ